jgi:predicted PurR-regulated permease PerM
MLRPRSALGIPSSVQVLTGLARSEWEEESLGGSVCDQTTPTKKKMKARARDAALARMCVLLAVTQLIVLVILALASYSISQQRTPGESFVESLQQMQVRPMNAAKQALALHLQIQSSKQQQIKQTSKYAARFSSTAFRVGQMVRGRCMQ